MNLQISKTYIVDLDVAIKHSVGIEKLKNSTVLITGATGTIGSFVADMLLRYNQIEDADITICVSGRCVDKLKQKFSVWRDPKLIILKYDLMKPIEFNVHVDYIIHAAGNAHPKAFNSDPVGTIIGNVNGTYNLLEYLRLHEGKRLLYVSSGEVYGQGDLSLDEFDEQCNGYIDVLSPRSCYPQSKRATENLCASYTSEFALETVIVRPCHTYGPGITSTDSRANAQFIRNVLKNENIVMKSVGSQLRSYNYIADCASAILTVLMGGESGKAYNIANPNVRITIAELAGIIADASGKKVVFSDPTAMDIANRTPIAKQVLSSKKIEELGWKGAFSAKIGIKHTLDIMKGK